MAKKEQAGTSRKRATSTRAPAAGSRRVGKARSESGAVRRPRRAGGEGEAPEQEKVPGSAAAPEEAVSTEMGAGAPAAPGAEAAPAAPAAASAGQPQGPGAAPVSAERRAEAERVVRTLLGHMGFSARLEVKDAPDGGLAMAVHFEGETPAGVQAGRRSPVMDSLQFISNKLFNKPGMERCWLSLGAFGFPEPRVPGAKKPPQAPAPAPAAKAAPAAPAPGQQAAAQAPAQRPERAARGGEADERTLQVSEDAALAAEARALTEKAAKLGRFYALVGLSAEDRARVLRAAAGVAGVRVHAEGEGSHRRVVFSPEKPAPLPKRNALPDWDEDEDEDV